jgi:hypothetical protein
MTMREKLLVAAAVANGDAAKTAAEPGGPEFLRSATANFANIIDAILTTLAEPDEGMTSALVAAVRKQVAWISSDEGDSGAASEVHFVDAGSIDVEEIRAAMINHVRSGK